MRILIVDDDRDITKILKTALELEDFEVTSTNHAKEALAIAIEEKPDLILLDLMMPEMDGWSLYRELKKHDNTKDIKIVILSAKALPEDIERGKNSGIDDYITKPFDPFEVAKKLKEILSEK